MYVSSFTASPSRASFTELTLTCDGRLHAPFLRCRSAMQGNRVADIQNAQVIVTTALTSTLRDTLSAGRFLSNSHSVRQNREIPGLHIISFPCHSRHTTALKIRLQDTRSAGHFLSNTHSGPLKIRLRDAWSAGHFFPVHTRDYSRYDCKRPGLQVFSLSMHSRDHHSTQVLLLAAPSGRLVPGPRALQQDFFTTQLPFVHT